MFEMHYKILACRIHIVQPLPPPHQKLNIKNLQILASRIDNWIHQYVITWKTSQKDKLPSAYRGVLDC